MTAVVVVEAVAIALLSLLVAGLLRSHAEILAALHRMGADVAVGQDSHALRHRPAESPLAIRLAAGDRPKGQRGGQPVADISGLTPSGEAIQVGLVAPEVPTLIAFLSSGCGSCGPLWQGLGAALGSGILPQGLRVVVATRGPQEESASALASLSPPGAVVVMSSQAWADYSVPGSPYFAYVAPGSEVVSGEGVGRSWEQVADLLARSEADSSAGAAARSGAEREARADTDLMAAGVWPGHRSLYPKGLPGESARGDSAPQ